MKTKLTLALMALITSSAFAGIPKVLPEFKNEKQLAEWRDEMAAKPAATTTATEDHAFYTGKPYIASTGSYAFKYRSYKPELARWTSEDPSGFPDGANGYVYAPIPTSNLDFAGLWTINVLGNSNPSHSQSGIVDTAWYSDDETITSSASLSVRSGAGTANIGVIGTSIGRIYPLHDWTAVVRASFTVSVDSSGNMSIAPAAGGWDNVDNDLQVAATYNVTDLGDNKKRLTFTGASIYEGSGLSGAGVLGASLSWTSGTGKVSAFVSIDFQAIE